MMRWLERQWYRDGLCVRLLMPLSGLLGLLVSSRRFLYRCGWLASWRAPVPVIVVGNISVGGTGKTPLVLWLVDFLKSCGYHPGIVSRGYGGRVASVAEVIPHGDPAFFGDEPSLMARRAACPVFVGRDRPAAARALLDTYPECDVLVCDDGLQHYALQRDVEIVVVDGERLYGNGALMPAGPLREPLARLAEVDAVVVNGGAVAPRAGEFSMVLGGHRFYRLADQQSSATAADFAGKRVHAIAGIGHPSRFFNHLRAMGLEVTEHAFPDHHAFVGGDLQISGADAILMTEKDAVKCFGFAPAHAWYLPVNAEVQGVLGEKILEKISKVP